MRRGRAKLPEKGRLQQGETKMPSRNFRAWFMEQSLEKLNLFLSLDPKFLGLEEKYLFLLFSGRWCASCRQLTPILKSFYKAYRKEKNFEVIFISHDVTNEEYDIYSEDMPWKSLPFQHPLRYELDEVLVANNRVLVFGAFPVSSCSDLDRSGFL
jgi:thiol-disulfide isomerase/thioredoxin